MKAQRPSKKCSSFIKKMVTSGKWHLNERIPSLSKISLKLNISSQTVRKVIREFEEKGVIENWGSLGFYLISNMVDKRNITNYWISRAISSLDAYEILSDGGKRIGCWLISCLDNNVKGFNEISGQRINATLDEIVHSLSKPIMLDKILSIADDKEFFKAKKDFERQREIRPVARIINLYKKDFNIQ